MHTFTQTRVRANTKKLMPHMDGTRRPQVSVVVPSQRGRRGFTLIELMVVVVVIGVLSAIAIPAFIKYIKQSKTSEAHVNLKNMGDGAAAYYNADHYDTNGIPVSEKQFPTVDSSFGDASTAALPVAIPMGTKTDVPTTSWATSPWSDLRYSISKPVYYRYMYNPVNTPGGTNDQFTSHAQGDLDGDLIHSHFMLVGDGYQSGDVDLTPVFLADPNLELE